MGETQSVVPALTTEASLKRRIRAHLRELGFERNRDGDLVQPASTKASIREIHSAHRMDIQRKNSVFVDKWLPNLRSCFASGNELDPEKIDPRLVLVESNTWQAALFRVASQSWSIPVSAGFGRRIRYLVWDQYHDKLIGLMALGDPVFNLNARDDIVGWNSEDRKDRLVNILDAYVLGAIPPYNSLLCGKLVASLVRTHEVRRDFQKKYGRTVGLISKKEKRAKLVMVTTSSALGRSSVYNRLTLGGEKYLTSIGYTGGWGHFHIPDDLFQDLRSFLRANEHGYVDGHAFGNGPNWRLRTIRAALDELGFKGDLLKHGIQREVFVSTLASNAAEILRGIQKRPDYSSLKTVAEVSELAKERWIVPRAARRPDFQNWKPEYLDRLLKTEGSAGAIKKEA